MRPETGQQLTLSSLAVFLPDVAAPLGNAVNSLAGLSLPRLVGVSPGATLVLQDVVLVIPVVDLKALYRSLCASTSAWPYSTGVVLDGGEVRIRELDSVDGSLPGGGGLVRWRNVNITCPGNGLSMPWSCAAAPVDSAAELLRMSTDFLGSVWKGAVFLSIKDDVALPAADQFWPPTVPFGTRVVLVGDPNRRPVVDLVGLEGAWPEAPWSRSPGHIDSWSVLPVAHLRDLTLVNLPLAAAPESPGELMALVEARRDLGHLSLESDIARVTLTRCTLVLSDEELTFLQREAARGAGGGGGVGGNGGSDGPNLQQHSASGELGIELRVLQGSGGSSGVPSLDAGRLEVAMLRMLPQVLLLNCTLLSASAYAALPGAVELLPQSRVWPPLLLHGDEETAMTQGPFGLPMAQGLWEALTARLPACGDAPDLLPIVLVSSHDDRSVGSASQLTTATSPPEGGGAAAAGGCAVSGLPEDLGVGRTFVDLKGLSGMFALRRPVSLRNLVLYNLAPGGSNGTGALPSGLAGPDAPWANSSLPLWLFSFDRSSAGGAASSAQEPQLQPSGTTSPGGRRSLAAAAATARQANGKEAPAAGAPLLSLHNVTLPLSYDPEAGTLVLGTARHYGWTGTNVTILCTLPPDAPPTAGLLPYTDLTLPYQSLAALNLNIEAVFRTVATQMSVSWLPSTGGAGSARLDADSFLRTVSAELSDADLRIASVLASGAFGVVYCGTWRGVPVAVKTLVVPAETAGPEGRARQRAVLEAAISMSMAHPNVVGKGVAGSVRAGGAARALALRLALDVAQGMRHVHSSRIVHGDLKPDNVLLAYRPSDEGALAAGCASAQAANSCSQPSPTGADGAGADAAAGGFPLALSAKVADFGLSLPLAEGATHASKHFHGTPAYSAPEASAHFVSVVIARGELSPRADVWSFGLMLLEFFYGCTLSDMRAVQAMVCSVREPGTVSLQDWLLKDMRESAHLQYADLAAACLSAEPRQRPDFGEICSRLQAVLLQS
ncbi:hypothetical protein GPECTOR_15g368 [Gonium pectorale]|uniref:Protein kinase domain-containing protein n=1 Tax=Gonium pectorale TaxID=33097 RepID=A0A150GLK3_GONPE|nr:hypothetical protein GPECTOR_15g368 [Gonium pectorale]|eukprot:KXZ50684.1 hypothetical protein GPECTOR_15g368 [Gonium pectorale]